MSGVFFRKNTADQNFFRFSLSMLPRKKSKSDHKTKEGKLS